MDRVHLIASIGVAAPLVIYVVMGDRAAEVLDALKAWVGQNNTAVWRCCA